MLGPGYWSRGGPVGDMAILVPFDDTDPGVRALEYAADLAKDGGRSVEVAHFTEVIDEDAHDALERAEAILDDEGVEGHPEVKVDLQLTTLRHEDEVGRDVLTVLEDGDYEEVVMGHAEEGSVQRLIEGSAVQTVIEGADVPVTVVP